MRGEIVKATPSHAIAMAPHVRAIEVREVMDASSLNVEAALLMELERSDSAWAWIVDGEVACMFGIVRGHSLMDFAAYPWFLSTPLVETHRIAFARACKTLLPELLLRHARLAGMVDARHTLSVRWLKWLGAKLDDPQPWGAAGAPFHHFEIDGAARRSPPTRVAERHLTIVRATVAELESDPNLPALLAEYAAESANTEIGPASPQMATYRAIEATGGLCVFAARVDGKLIGFMLFLLSVLPHFGRKVGVTESYFVAAEHRKTGAGLRLLHAAEDFARMEGAAGLLVSAPVGGILNRVMPGVGYRETNRVFFKGLQ